MNDNPSPFSIHPDEQLEARITAWVLGEASPFEIAELESLVAKSPELQLFLARTLAIHSLLKEAETTANAPSEDWKLPDEKRAKLSPILGDIPILVPEKESRIRRASFRAAWGIAAVLILTFFTERFLFIPATSDKNMSQTVRKPADIADESGAPLGNATPEQMFAKDRGSPASIPIFMLSLAESAEADGGSMAFVARSGGINDNDKQQAATLGNTRPSARREGQAESSVELEEAFLESRARSVETSTNRVTGDAILNNSDRAAKARNRGHSESKKPTGKVDMIVGSILETEGSPRAESLGLPPTPSESELAPLAADEYRKALEDSVSLPQDLARSLRDKAQKKADLSDLSTEIPAAQEPFSTFSLNISDVSFQLALAAVEKGERPDPESIKPEQFYNAVDYGDPAPSSLEPVAAAIDQTAHPVIPGRNLVRVAIRTASTGRSAAQPLRLTLLVDQSGSMARADRRAAMNTALAQLATLLTENDQVTVIGFSRTLRLIADSLPGNEAAKIPDLINPSASEGGTNLEQALNLSSELALRHQLDGAQNRIVLFTDGAANLGDADPDRLAERVKELRQQGLAFDIAGIGTNDTNDRLLSELARHGNGRYYLVGKNAGDSFAAQLAGAFRPAAENVKVQVKLNPERVGNYKLIGFEKDRLKTEDFHDDSVDAAELAADEAGVAIYQVETLPEGSGEIGEVSVRFRDTASGEMVERAWTIPHDPSTPALDKAAPQTQLATLALLAAQKLQGGPLADAIRFPDHAETIAKLKQAYANDPKAQRLLTLINALR
jgi:Mg-chelatase subunit ChlD